MMRQLAWLSPWMQKYFDDFPVVWGDMHEDIVGSQYPRPELAEKHSKPMPGKVWGRVLGLQGISTPTPLGLWGVVSQMPYSI